MKKIFIVCVLAFTILLPGCGVFNHSNVPIAPKPVQVWWGTKQEIKTFLDSPEAQAKRWIVESIGG
jgi:hypothetical protein